MMCIIDMLEVYIILSKTRSFTYRNYIPYFIISCICQSIFERCGIWNKAFRLSVIYLLKYVLILYNNLRIFIIFIDIKLIKDNDRLLFSWIQWCFIIIILNFNFFRCLNQKIVKLNKVVMIIASIKNLFYFVCNLKVDRFLSFPINLCFNILFIFFMIFL